MEEGQVVSWLKAEGDVVANGDVIAEIETDKATMELVARGDGTLRKIFVEEGGVALVGNVIAVIAADDEDISAIVEAASASAAAPPATSGEESDTAIPAEAPPAAEPAPAAIPVVPAESLAPPEEVAAVGGRIKASPVARKLAAESGVPLGAITGSGPGGRIVKRDVEDAVVSGVTSAAPAGGSASAPTSAPAASGFAARAATFVAAGPEYEDIPLSQMRKTIAKRLVQSIGPVPHFFLTIDVDMTRAVEARASINRLLERDGAKISLNDMIMKATAAALRLHPACNAHWMGTAVRRFNQVHIGVAVAVEDGLITPVIRNADAKGMVAIGSEVRELAGRAREKRLKPEEYTGATFSISNLGMFGIHEFTAVINPPEAAILAVGAVEERPIVIDGKLETQPRMKLTMSCDHRVIDGATGAQFLQTLRAFLEEPAAVLVV